ncbi:Ketoreductase azaE [Psilocybe cubensis]|uniref:Ketoreductase azaE n=1 Tax=Psilocybe cubensis TaxID=181762 RepID=A0ACB8HHA1_PSICU|nr:Ketoreductase azaE [Psilocybe cubensis]KAH9487405.1 Ketoreductase azaE [Psilocybe cubensis]
MPALQSNSGVKVLVTGANGFVAMAIIQRLLGLGFSVRGTVRSQEKAEETKKIFSSYGDRLELLIIEDLTQDGALDDAVKGIDAIEHTASPGPGHLPDEDPYEIYINPAVQGTLSILNSILKNGSQVKRVVITSSLAAMMRPIDGPTVLDENDWGDEYVRIVETQGKSASPMEKYYASKTLSERAAWDFCEKHKGMIGWDLVTINPSLPLLQDFQELHEVTPSVRLWFHFMATEQSEEILKSTLSYVDVRDVSAAHVNALKVEDAGGQRFILSAESITWQDSRNHLLDRKPEYYTSGIFKRGNPNLKSYIPLTLKTQKAESILGIKYKSRDETLLSVAEEYRRRGFL